MCLRRLGRLACDFSPVFLGENSGETGAPVPLFAANVGVTSSTRQKKLGYLERMEGADAAASCRGGEAPRCASEAVLRACVGCYVVASGKTPQARPDLTP